MRDRTADPARRAALRSMPIARIKARIAATGWSLQGDTDVEGQRGFVNSHMPGCSALGRKA